MNVQTIICLIKRDTTDAYKKQNPVLRLNELAVEYNNNKIVGYKIGDGTTQWSELPYITKFTNISEFWIYVDLFCHNKSHIAVTKIILDPFVINNFLGKNEKCSTYSTPCGQRTKCDKKIWEADNERIAN